MMFDAPPSVTKEMLNDLVLRGVHKRIAVTTRTFIDATNDNRTFVIHSHTYQNVYMAWRALLQDMKVLPVRPRSLTFAVSRP